jgi:hypothetical protein
MIRATLLAVARLPVAGARGGLLLTVLLLLSTAGAKGANPWRLHCASMPTERTLPAPLRTAALRFFPWVHPAAKGLRSGRVDLVALSTKTAISRDGDHTDGAGYYLHRALIAVAPSFSAAVAITGRRLGRRGHRTSLGFSTNGANRCTVRGTGVFCGSQLMRFRATLRIGPGSRWRIVPTELRIGRTGCFRITATGPGLQNTIPLAVPGPDYGTAGW